VLVTHEHPDHLSIDNLAATDAPVYTIAAVAEAIASASSDVTERVTTVAPGDQLDLGLPVRVVGEKHAVIHPDLPRFDNSGFLVEAEGRRIFHPGDALTEVIEDVDLQFLPVHAPWNKYSEVLDYARAVGAARNVAIHDMLLSDKGLALLERMFEQGLGEREQSYQRVAAGQDLDLG